jgi:hypothetical protein
LFLPITRLVLRLLYAIFLFMDPGNQLFSVAVCWESSAVRLRPTTLVKEMNGELKARTTETAKCRIGAEVDGRTYDYN